jgi:hypothetical protein
VADVAEKRVGSRTYFVHGLESRAEAIRGATRRIVEATSTRVTAAQAAIREWRGPHAATFVERVNHVLA